MKKGMIKIDGTRLRKLRENNGYSLEYLGKLCNCQKQTLSNIENGKKTKIHKSILPALAKHLNCTPDYLQGFVQNPNDVVTEFSKDGLPLKTKRDAIIFDSLKDKIYCNIACLPEEYIYRLEKFVIAYSELDDPHLTLLENIADNIMNTSKRSSDITFEANETNSYIYNYLLEHTIPSIKAKAETILSSPNSSASLKTLDNKINEVEDIKYHINLQLGSFQKDTNILLEKTLKNILSASFKASDNENETIKCYIHSQIDSFQEETNRYLESILKSVSNLHLPPIPNLSAKSALEDAIDIFVTQLKSQLRKQLLYDPAFYSPKIK